MKSILFCIVLCLGLNTFAQDHFIIENVRLFDGFTVREQVHVSVNNGKISKISKTPIANDEAIVIDGRQKTLIPALSNAHVHAWMPANLNEAAKAGVLNVFDMHGVEMAQGFMRSYKDSTNYANYYAAGAAATAPEGHGTQYGFPTPTLSKPEEAKQFVQDRIKNNADYIKIIFEPWKPTLTSETIAELIKEAHNANTIAVVHVSRLEDGLDVIKNGADGLVHIWNDKPLNDVQLKALSERKDFFVIPTLLTTLGFYEAIGENSNKLLSKAQLLGDVKKLYDAGIPILAGTDPPNVGINYGTDLYKELKLLAEAGISNIDVLKSATSHVATAFKLKGIGQISEGSVANMILIDGNPLADINDIDTIEMIWKAGKIVE